MVDKYLEEAKQAQYPIKDFADTLSKAESREDILAVVKLLTEQADELEEIIQRMDDEDDDDQGDLEFIEEDDSEDPDEDYDSPEIVLPPEVAEREIQAGLI